MENIVNRIFLTLAAMVLAAVFMMLSCTVHQVPVELFVSELHTELISSDSIPRYGIIELSFKHNGVYDNDFFDVAINVVFTSPSGAQHRVKGFFYGSDLWKVRFRPEAFSTRKYLLARGFDAGIGNEIADDCAVALAYNDCPQVENVFTRAIHLPLHEGVSDQQIERLAKLLRKKYP